MKKEIITSLHKLFEEYAQKVEDHFPGVRKTINIATIFRKIYPQLISP